MLANIKKNTRRFWCKIREVYMYEDVLYKRDVESSTTQKQTYEQTFAGSKAAPKLKDDAVAKPQKEKPQKEEADVPLSDKQIKKLEGTLTKLQENQQKLKDAASKVRFDDTHGKIPEWMHEQVFPNFFDGCVGDFQKENDLADFRERALAHLDVMQYNERGKLAFAQVKRCTRCLGSKTF